MKNFKNPCAILHIKIFKIEENCTVVILFGVIISFTLKMYIKYSICINTPLCNIISVFTVY